jgi:hypothetical protein
MLVWLTGVRPVLAQPILKISETGSHSVLAWPLIATNFARLQPFASDLNPQYGMIP